jgi:anti-sigma regulatory factor (Ser/Thr protein kinase)
LLYGDEAEFLAGTVPFLEAGIRSGEPMLVAVPPPKIAALTGALGPDAEAVTFVDMTRLGENPARIIPTWCEFVAARAPGVALRGIAEPVWAGRTPAELAECRCHEALVNLAFAHTPGFRLLCPYDTGALGDDVILEARCTHPRVRADGAARASDDYCGPDAGAMPFTLPLAAPPRHADTHAFDAWRLPHMRQVAWDHGTDAGLSAQRASDLAFALNEVTTNSVRYGGGGGTVRLWNDERSLVCDVQDHGRIDQPLAGRLPPNQGQIGGWGLWLANQLCDLVQLRTFASGTTVRLHMHR